MAINSIVGRKLSGAELDKLMHTFDLDGDESIDVSEFEQLIRFVNPEPLILHRKRLHTHTHTHTHTQTYKHTHKHTDLG